MLDEIDGSLYPIPALAVKGIFWGALNVLRKDTEKLVLRQRWLFAYDFQQLSAGSALPARLGTGP
jgi:hypothetical protein